MPSKTVVNRSKVMDYLEMWQKGFKEGKDFTLDELNKHCETNFADLVALIMYVRNVELNKKTKADHVEG